MCPGCVRSSNLPMYKIFAGAVYFTVYILEGASGTSRKDIERCLTLERRARPPQSGDMVSTLPSSPARKPGNPSPRSYHGLGRRRREDIRAIRCGGSNCCGPKSTRRKTIELNRSCFYRTGLVEGWNIDRSGPLPREPVLCRCATRDGLPLHPSP